MRDPFEGVSAAGTITTGVHESRIEAVWRPVLDDVVRAVSAVAPDAAVHVYGSVATGQAVPGRSDVDLLVIGLPATDAAAISGDLSAAHAGWCREVALGAAAASDFEGDHDEAYGNRVFLRHYCVHVAGPDGHRPGEDFPADERAARGFNGDIGRHRDRWRTALDRGDDPGPLARRIARKTLLALAGLVSVHDVTWTTDRETAARRWSEIEPRLVDGLATMLGWIDDVPGAPVVRRSEVAAMLDGTVDPLVDRFAADIGLWT